jgi:hypothetical protein
VSDSPSSIRRCSKNYLGALIPAVLMYAGDQQLVLIVNRYPQSYRSSLFDIERSNARTACAYSRVRSTPSSTGCQILTGWLFELIHHYHAGGQTPGGAACLGDKAPKTETPSSNANSGLFMLFQMLCAPRSPLMPKVSASTFHSRFDALLHRRDRLQGLSR